VSEDREDSQFVAYLTALLSRARAFGLRREEEGEQQ